MELEFEKHRKGFRFKTWVSERVIYLTFWLQKEFATQLCCVGSLRHYIELSLLTKVPLLVVEIRLYPATNNSHASCS